MARLPRAGFWVLPGLKGTFYPEALADLRDFSFASVERRLARVNGIVAEHEVVGMLDRRAQDKARLFERFKFESAVRLFEHRHLPLVHDLRRSQLSPMHPAPPYLPLVR